RTSGALRAAVMPTPPNLVAATVTRSTARSRAHDSTPTGSPGPVPVLHDRVVRRRCSSRRTVRVSPRLSSRPVTSAARRCLGFVYAWRRDEGGGYGVVVAPPADVA